MPPELAHLLIYLLTGGAAGFLAGLFGVGGGLVIVPALAWVFELSKFAPELHVKMAVATSMAIIIPTGASGAWAHHRKQNVNWGVVKALLPWVAMGSVMGALGGSHVSSMWLAGCVCLFQLSMCVKYLREALATPKEKHADERAEYTAPDLLSRLMAAGIGALSSVIGIAGGSLFVPLLHAKGLSLRQAIGASSGLGVFTGIFAAVVYATAPGTTGTSMPSYSLGYIYLPALAGCVAGSLCLTRAGADLAHRLEARALKGAFACVLFTSFVKMAWKLLGF